MTTSERSSPDVEKLAEKEVEEWLRSAIWVLATDSEDMEERETIRNILLKGYRLGREAGIEEVQTVLCQYAKDEAEFQQHFHPEDNGPSGEEMTIARIQGSVNALLSERKGEK